MQHRIAVASLVAVMVAACSGGGDDAGASTATTTSAAVSTAAATTPSTTSTTGTTLATTTTSTTVAAVTAEVLTDPPPTLDAAFCNAAADVFVAGRASDLAAEATPATVEALIEFMAFAVIDLIDSAPEPWATRSGDLLTAISEFDIALGEYEYDLAAARSAGDTERLAEPASVIDSTVEELGIALETDCAESLDELASNADALLAYVTDDGVPDDAATATDDTGRIRVDVPSDWSVDGTALADVIRLTAATDLMGFDESWLVDGIRVTALDVEPGTAEPAALLELASAPGDCELVSTEPYSDVLDTGEIRSYAQCGGTDAYAFVVTVGDLDLATEIVTEGQFTNPDDATFARALDSFVVDPAT